LRILIAIAAVMAAVPAAAVPVRTPSPFIQSIDQIMEALASQNLQASRAIRRVYAPLLDLLVLAEYADLEGALESGRLAPLPSDPRRFNLAPRLDGPNPIGEKDLHHQHSYIAARPATIGLLIEIASRVKSGPLEITSLVRHGEYQDSLRGTNVNANTAVPMHTMGLAFDIALVNTPLKTIQEIRDVLIRMRDAGDLMFIGERRQVVFHVVPHPARIAHFSDVYNRAVGVPSAVHGAHVIAASPTRLPARKGAKPQVKAEVIAILPTDEFASEWWIGESHAHPAVLEEPALPLTVASAAIVPTQAPASGTFRMRLLTVLAGLVATVAALRRQQRDQLRGEGRSQIFDAADAAKRSEARASAGS
jgi:hypothetical protein